MKSSSKSSINVNAAIWIPAVSAAIYPWLLEAFHWCITPSASAARDALPSASALLLAALLMIAAFAVPMLNLLIAGHRPTAMRTPEAATIRARRFALLAVTAPTVYVFFGVLSYMAGSKVPDAWIWTPVWLVFGYLVSRSTDTVVDTPKPAAATLRVAHGISGAIVALYVLFHIVNHLYGLISPEAHKTVMEMGRTVYRATFIEPILVGAMLFQVWTGLRLVWTWSTRATDRYRMFQTASGVFLSLFILGHMNSVFIFARTWMNIPTDWAFATGLPTGLIHDAWNIRLVPHYALGVFFVLAHLCSGLRVVMLAHGTKAAIANRLWWTGATLSAVISAAILCGMTGLRLM